MAKVIELDSMPTIERRTAKEVPAKVVADGKLVREGKRLLTEGDAKLKGTPDKFKKSQADEGAEIKKYVEREFNVKVSVIYSSQHKGFIVGLKLDDKGKTMPVKTTTTTSNNGQ